jgi:hypothetical protein
MVVLFLADIGLIFLKHQSTLVDISNKISDSSKYHFCLIFSWNYILSEKLLFILNTYILLLNECTLKKKPIWSKTVSQDFLFHEMAKKKICHTFFYVF